MTMPKKTTSSIVDRLPLPDSDRCANIACPNRAGQGQFELTVVHVGGVRDLYLYLCSPCAEELQKVLLT